MSQLIWTPKALSDVQRLYRFLALKDIDAARRAVRTVREGVKILDRHSYAGRPVDGMSPEFREWSIGFGSGEYIVLYRVDEDCVTLLAIRHGREAEYSQTTR